MHAFVVGMIFWRLVKCYRSVTTVCFLVQWTNPSIRPTQEFNKKFRGSDDFKASVAEDKIESFGKVLQKFFDTEREDYKKDAAAKIPDYDYLVKKAGQAGTTKEDASTMSPF